MNSLGTNLFTVASNWLLICCTVPATIGSSTSGVSFCSCSSSASPPLCGKIEERGILNVDFEGFKVKDLGSSEGVAPLDTQFILGGVYPLGAVE